MSLPCKTASFSSLNGIAAATGPKISSRAILILLFDVGKHRRLDEVALACRPPRHPTGHPRAFLLADFR